MGYSHQWRTQSSILTSDFDHIVNDTMKIFPIVEKMGIFLSGPKGVGKYILNDTCISFNGRKNCGHINQNIVIAWPTIKSKGINDKKISHNNSIDQIPTMIDTRVCGGSCMYEPFIFEKISTMRSSIDKKFPLTNRLPHFSSCKTSFKPYDIPVMMTLIIIKHYLKNDVYITSDGDINKWNDALSIIKHFLGYGNDFQLDNL